MHTLRWFFRIALLFALTVAPRSRAADKAPPEKTPTEFLGGEARYLTYVSTDKPIYRLGENVLMRGVILHCATHAPAVETLIATIELKDPLGKTLLTTRTESIDSVLTFRWPVPADAAGGQYLLKLSYEDDHQPPAERAFEVRAYRAPRLRNQIVFQREGYGAGAKVTATLHSERAEGGIPDGARVNVVASVDGQEINGAASTVDAHGNCTVVFTLPEKLTRGEGTLALIVQDSGVVESASKTIPILMHTVDVKIYPEGGELVAGVNNRVYFEARLPNGKPADLAGEIVDMLTPGEPAVAQFRSEHEGRGRFEFTPSLKAKYALRITEPAGVEALAVIPQAKPKSDAVAIHLDQDVCAAGAPIKLTLSHSSEKSEPFTVALSQREVEVASTKVEFTTEQRPVEFNPPAEISGVLRVTVWSAHGWPVAERLLYRQPAKSLHLAVTTDKAAYIPGDSVQLSIKATDADGKPAAALVGLTVSDDSVLQLIDKREQAPRLPVMVLLESDVKDFADADVYLDPSNPKAPLAVDLLLGTQGWRRFAFFHPKKFLDANGDAARRVLALSGRLSSRGAIDFRPNKLRDDWSIVHVPPDILARAELGDHFETIGADADVHAKVERAGLDMKNLFANANAKEAAGGGGMGGVGPEDLIGVGGGWGGGNGTGVGVDQGNGHGSFGNRNGGGRRLMVKRHGGSRATENAVETSLSWLAFHQEADGHWDSLKCGADARADTATTGLALLAFLGAGHTEKVGAYKDNVKRAIAWLKSAQHENGLLFSKDDEHPLHVGLAHAIAGQALAEAAGLARVPDTLQAAQKAVEYSENIHQNADGDDRLGWGTKIKGKNDLVVSGWFIQQLKCAKVAQLKVDVQAFDGAIHLLDEKEDGDHHYRAEPGLEATPYLTAVGVLSRLRLGWGAEELEPTVKWFIDGGGVPDAEHPDLLYWMAGTQAAFFTGGDLWKKWNEGMKKTLVEIQHKDKDDGSGSFSIPADKQSMSSFGTVGQTALACTCLETYYRYKSMQIWQSAPLPEPVRYSREFAHALRPNRKPADRADFAETLYWNAALKTDPVSGEATVRFALNDSVTSFRVFADAFNRAGLLGAATSEIHAVQPFYVEPKLPLEVSVGDTIRLPLNVVSSIDSPFSGVSLDAQIAGNFTLSKIDPFDLNGMQRLRRTLDIAVGSNNGVSQFILNAKAGPYSDTVTRPITVKPYGFPAEINFGGVISKEQPAAHAFTIPAFSPGSLTTHIRVYPTPLAKMTQALERLIVEPSGCFEQTSSTTYPLTMAQQYFLSHQDVEARLIESSREKLERGYAKLVSFWCPDRGYEWFGEDPGHEALTAFGLLLFADMKRVRDVDAKMVATTRAWLLKQRDGHGGFERKRRALHTWIEDKDCSNAYITWALLESGEKELTAEVAAVKASAAKSSNSYVVALAANVMALTGDTETAAVFCDKLAAHQQSDGSVSGGTASIVGSEGLTLDVETTALAALAWLRDPRYAVNAQNSMRFLAASCQDGRYGSTQSTVLALRAIVLFDTANARPKAPGTLRMLLDHAPVGEPIAFSADASGTIDVPDLAPFLKTGEHTLEVQMADGSAMPYSIAIGYNAPTPVSSKNCSLDVAVKLSRTELNEGDAAEVLATVTNKQTVSVPMSIAIVGLPGGLEPRHDQLKELVKKHTIDFYEVRGNEVVLYWRGLGPKATVDVPLSVIAAVPGRYTGAASRAYLYYSDESKQWVEGLKVNIAAK